jgi:hypothetical protein
MRTYLQWVCVFTVCSGFISDAVIVLDPRKKLDYFKKHWPANLQAEAIANMEVTVSVQVYSGSYVANLSSYLLVQRTVSRVACKPHRICLA